MVHDSVAFEVVLVAELQVRIHEVGPMFSVMRAELCEVALMLLIILNTAVMGGPPALPRGVNVNVLVCTARVLVGTEITGSQAPFTLVYVPALHRKAPDAVAANLPPGSNREVMDSRVKKFMPEFCVTRSASTTVPAGLYAY